MQCDSGRGTVADVLSTARRRVAIMKFRRALTVSQRRICCLLGQHRSTQRHPPRDHADERRLTADIIALVKDYGRYGYRRIHALLGHAGWRSEEHTSELQSLMRNSYAVFCLKKKTTRTK